jgi:hypothetical protein
MLFIKKTKSNYMNFMEAKTWATDNRLGNQQFCASYVIWRLIHISSPHVCVVSQMNPAHMLPS